MMNFIKKHSINLEDIIERFSDYLEFRKFLEMDKNDSLFLQLRGELDTLNYNFYDFYKKISKEC